MTAKLFIALYVGLIAGMVVLFVANFALAWVFFGFLFIAVFGGLALINHPRIIVAGFMLTSLIVLGAGLYSLQQPVQASGWPTAPGVITASSMCTQRIYGGNYTNVYSGPCIEYRYAVNEQPYVGKSQDTYEFFGRGWSSIPDIYRVDRTVKVSYDPSNPAVSRLTVEVPIGDWTTTAVGAIMTALSAFTLLWLFLTRQGNPHTVAPVNAPEERGSYRDMPAPGKDSSTSDTPDLADQLEKLADLHKNKALTDEEYALAKKRLLGSE
jgi:hypothetical protein